MYKTEQTVGICLDDWKEMNQNQSVIHLLHIIQWKLKPQLCHVIRIFQ